MFTISSPITTPDSTSGAGFMLSSTPSSYATTVVISNPQLGGSPAQHPVSTIVPITPPAIVAGVVTVPAPPNVRVRTLTINGITYNYTLFSPPPIGYFTQSNGLMQIGYLGLVPPTSIGYYLAPITIDTDYLPAPYPSICFGFPLTGELTWTLNWEEQPTASFKFITDANQKSKVESYFGAVRNIEIYGINFCPSGQIQITEISRSKSAIPLIEVSVSLTGFTAHLLDRYISLGIVTTLPNCTAPPNALGNSPSSMTVQDLALKLGTSVTGAAINIDANILLSPATPITLSGVLESKSVRGVGAFIDYHTTGVKLVPYNGVTLHSIDPDLILSDVSGSTNLKIGISGSYYKTFDPLTKITFGSNPPTPKTAVPIVSWQPKPSTSTTTTDGDPDPGISPYIGAQKDPSIVFDISGKRKRKKVTTLVNGQPTHEVEEEWGYVAVGKDDIVFVTGVANPPIDYINGSWRKIEGKTTDYTYNSLGYLVSVVSTGFKLARFRTENAQKPESLAVRIDPLNPDPGEVANLQTFRFFSLPTSKSETYTLAKMSAYYDDIKVPQVNQTICLPDGTQATIPVADKSYIEPYFVAQKVVVEDTFASTINPKSTALKPLPNLTTGKKSQFIERVRVQPKPTLSLSIVVTPPNPTEYAKSTDNYSASDGQFSNTLSIAESSIVSGRPPLATGIGATLELVVPPTATNPPPPPKPFAIKSGLSTENTGYISTNALNFPTAATKALAIEAARIDMNLINAKNAIVESALVDFRPHIRPGDLVDYSIGSGGRRRRAISITNTIKIDGRLNDGRIFVTTKGTQLKLGIDLDVPIIQVAIPIQTAPPIAL